MKKGEQKSDPAVDAVLKATLRLIYAIEHKDAKNVALLSRAIRVMITELSDAKKVNVLR